MAEGIEKVVIRKKAYEELAAYSLYIELKGYPETAEKFYLQLLEFAFSLKNFPNKYPVCRFEFLAKRNMRCAVFKKHYIFVYLIEGSLLKLYRVYHASRLK